MNCSSLLLLLQLSLSAYCMFSYRLAPAWQMKTDNSLFDQFVKTFNLNNNNAKSPSTKGSASSIKKVVITGATGLIGQELTKRFEQRDIEVVKVTSQKKLDGTPNVVVWDLNDSSVKNAELLNDADIVINMVGENVGEFWSEEKKQRITRSRMAGTALIVKKISELKKKPKLFISASGLSYYGYLKSEQVFDENDTVTDEPGIGCILTYCFILITIPPFIHSRCILVL